MQLNPSPIFSKQKLIWNDRLLPFVSLKVWRCKLSYWRYHIMIYLNDNIEAPIFSGLWKGSNVKLVHVIFAMLRLQPPNKRYIARTFKGLGSYPPIGHSFLSVEFGTHRKAELNQGFCQSDVIQVVVSGMYLSDMCVFHPYRMDRNQLLSKICWITKIGTWKKRLNTSCKIGGIIKPGWKICK